MNNQKLYLLLNAIDLSKGVSALLKHDLNYKEIADLVDEAYKRQFVAGENKTIVLTPIGKEELMNFRKQSEKRKKEDWIKPEEKSRIKKIDKNSIFLPNPINLILD